LIWPGNKQLFFLDPYPSIDILFSESTHPNLSFQVSCGSDVLLSGAFKGDASDAKAVTSYTPFELLRENYTTTLMSGSGTANVRSTLSFIPSVPSDKMVDFGIRVEKVIQVRKGFGILFFSFFHHKLRCSTTQAAFHTVRL
jgi:hypothetical protein